MLKISQKKMFGEHASVNGMGERAAEHLLHCNGSTIL